MLRFWIWRVFFVQSVHLLFIVLSRLIQEILISSTMTCATIETLGYSYYLLWLGVPHGDPYHRAMRYLLSFGSPWILIKCSRLGVNLLTLLPSWIGTGALGQLLLVPPCFIWFDLFFYFVFNGPLPHFHFFYSCITPMYTWHPFPVIFFLFSFFYYLV